jgi:hypothetical protein
MHAERIDGWILELLCETPGPWAVADLERECGGHAVVADAVGRLVSGGLVLRREGGFVVTSAAGRYANALGEERP